MAVNIGEAFGQDADRGQVVFLELIGQDPESPAERHHISGGERERQFLRRLVLVVGGVRVGFQRIFEIEMLPTQGLLGFWPRQDGSCKVWG